jgi:uncharacterized protein (DUF697 family)
MTSVTTINGSLEQAEHQKRARRVNLLVRNHSIVGAAFGAVPLPPAAMGLVLANALKMLHKLSTIYDVPFRRDVGKTIISSFLTGCGTVSISGRVAFGLGLAIPSAIPVLNVVTTPVFGAAMTYAIGHIFIQHFESGGTFLTLDPDKVRAHYAKLFEEGQELAKAQK